MYSREEAKKIRQQFWISFGRNYPRKWLLYNTKIKDLSLKFDFTRRYAEVSLEISSNDEIFRKYYFEKLESLKNIIKEEYLPEVIFAEDYVLDNGKNVSRIYIRLEDVNIHNRSNWEEVQEFLSDKMNSLELFFLEYKDFIEQ